MPIPSNKKELLLWLHNNLDNIPDDEPLFLIRGQDPAGPATLRHWRGESVGKVSGDKLHSAKDVEQRMVDFQHRAMNGQQETPQG